MQIPLFDDVNSRFFRTDNWSGSKCLGYLAADLKRQIEIESQQVERFRNQ